MVRISNFHLLELLEENARISYTDLAKKFKVSETAIRKRIKELEKKGIIKKYKAEINYPKLGFANSIIGIDVKPEKFLYLLETLKKIKKVKSLMISSGDHQLLIEVSFDNSEDLRKFIKSIEKIEGVLKVCPSIILERIK